MAAVGGYRRRTVGGGGGLERFYCPPAMRGRYKQQQMNNDNNISNNVNNNKAKLKGSYVESKNRIDSDHGASSTTTTLFSSPETRIDNVTNLDRFLEYTTPTVIAQQFPKTIIRAWKSNGNDFHPYFVLGDLWESYREWSAYGAGVPLVLNGNDSVVQYYVPYLSGIQLYIDPSKPFVWPKRPVDESDSDSSRESCCDGSNGGTVERGEWINPNTKSTATEGINRVSLRNNNFTGFAAAEGQIRNPPGLLIFEYLEQEPLADKISVLASRFPDIKTLRSCDLTPASWISVAWYPIYRIPTGPTLQNLDACFLTYHSLSTPLRSTRREWPQPRCTTICNGMHDSGMFMKLSLPIFGLAPYKFKVSVWNSDRVHDCQKTKSLLHAADNWLRLLQVNHPDYSFFMSRNLYLW